MGGALVGVLGGIGGTSTVSGIATNAIGSSVGGGLASNIMGGANPSMTGGMMETMQGVGGVAKATGNDSVSNVTDTFTTAADKVSSFMDPIGAAGKRAGTFAMDFASEYSKGKMNEYGLDTAGKFFTGEDVSGGDLARGLLGGGGSSKTKKEEDIIKLLLKQGR